LRAPRRLPLAAGVLGCHIATSVLPQRYPRPGQSRPTLPGDISTNSELVLAGQCGNQFGCAAAAVEEIAHVGTGAAEGLKGGDALEGFPAGDVEDDRVPGGRGDRLRVLAQAAAAEERPGVLRRVVDGVVHGRVVGEPGHPAAGREPVVQTAL